MRSLYYAYSFNKGRLFEGGVGFREQVIGLAKEYKHAHPEEKIDIINVKQQNIVIHDL